MHPDDTNVFASNNFEKYKNQPDNLHSMYLADFASSCHRKGDDLPIEPDEIKSYIVPVSNIDDVKCNLNIFLENELCEMQKLSRPCIIRFQSVHTEKPRRVLLETFICFGGMRMNFNRVTRGDILCNIKKHEPYLDIDEEENAEFSLINPNLI